MKASPVSELVGHFHPDHVAGSAPRARRCYYCDAPVLTALDGADEPHAQWVVLGDGQERRMSRDGPWYRLHGGIAVEVPRRAPGLYPLHNCAL